MKNFNYTLLAATAVLALAFTSCEKVSPIGVLVSGTGVEDRVKMSNLYFLEHKGDIDDKYFFIDGEYSFIVGADSHVTTDIGRMEEMLQIGLDNNDLLYAHLGDIADTKAEYYINLENCINKYKQKYGEKHFEKVFMGEEDEYYLMDDPRYYYYIDPENYAFYTYDNLPYPFFPVVGNHDITHNGWALWSNIFHSSFYEAAVFVNDSESDLMYIDHFIFLDTANGTLGEEQVKLIEEGILDGKELEKDGFKIRNTFVFSHTNIFRPSSLQFASTFPREETFFLLNQFKEWDAKIVFCGHVHKWDDQTVGGVRYITLDSMSERNSPDPGDYLVRVRVKKDGTYNVERVRMNYTAQKK